MCLVVDVRALLGLLNHVSMILPRTVIYTPLPIPILYTIQFHFLVSHTFSSLSSSLTLLILHLGFCDSWCVCFTSVSVTQFAALRFEQPPHNLALDPSFSLLQYPQFLSIYILSKNFEISYKKVCAFCQFGVLHYNENGYCASPTPGF